MAIFFGHSILCLAVAGVLVSTATGQQDRMITGNGVSAKAMGKSGKIFIGSGTNPDTEPNNMVVEFDEIKEYADEARTTEVGKSGALKHSFNTFASQTFTFSAVTNGTFQQLAVSTVEFSSVISSVSATVKVIIYIFKEDGTISIEGDDTTIEKGNVKFNIDISNWSFCGQVGTTCTSGSNDEIGNFLDFVITIKSKKTPTKRASSRRSKGVEFDVGNDQEIIMTNKYQHDGTSETMPTGYPMMETKGSKIRFHFMMKKFSTKVVYDPILCLNGSPRFAGTAMLAIALSFFVYLLS